MTDSKIRTGEAYSAQRFSGLDRVLGANNTITYYIKEKDYFYGIAAHIMGSGKVHVDHISDLKQFGNKVTELEIPLPRK
jgi:hypothetical protein